MSDVKTCRKGLHLRTPENIDKGTGACKQCRRDSQRRRYAEDPEFRARRLAYYRRRYRTDPEFAEKARQRASSPEARALSNARRRERYNSDPEYRARQLAKAREGFEPGRYHYPDAERRANERRKERLRTDPQYRAHVNAKRRERYVALKADPVRYAALREAGRFRKHAKRRAAGVPERQWREGGPRDRVLATGRDRRSVPARPFVAWLEGYLERHPDDSSASLARRAGTNDRSLYAWRTGERQRIHISVLDRLLLAAGEPNALNDLYPLNDQGELVA